MNEFRQITVAEAKMRMQTSKPLILDARDSETFAQEHIDGAILLTTELLQDFVALENKSQPIIVVCYHGNSSQGVAHYLSLQGFENVYSVIGGYEEWKTNET